ncbi:cyclase family protein [Erythrobacter mangrovi]|uniref:cyclase family protein n=1 Tax=Erythrobacter mangrovi TaxID=2739433 RepID=UPI0018F8BBF8|nr:cyclase family protein [Erythrobacter mangrovi]
MSPLQADQQAEPAAEQAQAGTLGKMSDRSRLDAMRIVAGGQVYDLGVELFVGMPDCCADAFGDPKYQLFLTHSPSRSGDSELVSHTSEAIFMSSHAGTHLDALPHFGLHGKIWNGADAKDALGVRGWSSSGAENYPPIIARGTLIDVAGAKGLERLPPSYVITVNDLKAALARQGSQIRAGDVVLIRTGQMTSWPDATGRSLFIEPGIGLEAAKWLAEETGAIMLGSDNFGLESFPSANPENFAPIHTYLLAERGMPFMESVWLEDLAREGVHEFLFVASPLKLKGASGAPVRPIAIPIAPQE